ERDGHTPSARWLLPPRRNGRAAGPGRSLPFDEDQDRDFRKSQVVPQRPTRLVTSSAEELDDDEEAVGTICDGVGPNGALEAVTPLGEVVVAARDRRHAGHVHPPRQGKLAGGSAHAIDVVEEEFQIPAAADRSGEATTDAPVDFDQERIVDLYDPDPLEPPGADELRGIVYIHQDARVEGMTCGVI